VSPASEVCAAMEAVHALALDQRAEMAAAIADMLGQFAEAKSGALDDLADSVPPSQRSTQRSSQTSGSRWPQTSRWPTRNLIKSAGNSKPRSTASAKPLPRIWPHSSGRSIKLPRSAGLGRKSPGRSAPR
jgi:hypothetical protein